jgi:hypothetical protein
VDAASPFISGSRTATGCGGLLRGTRNRPIRAEHAAVPCLGLQHHRAARAVVEVGARIGWHGLARNMPAVRTGELGSCNHCGVCTAAGTAVGCGSGASNARACCAKAWPFTVLSLEQRSCRAAVPRFAVIRRMGVCLRLAICRRDPTRVPADNGGTP